jgi:hypothetical protein
MAIILSSSDSAPLSSVVIYWNIVATTVNMLFRDELFALGAWTDCLGACWLCLTREGAGLCSWERLRLRLLLRITAAKVCPGVVWLEESTLPLVLGALWDFLFRISSLACLQPRCFERWDSSPSTNLPIVWSVKLLLIFASTVIPGFSPFEIHDKDVFLS